jgi:hypothetical protein
MMESADLRDGDDFAPLRPLDGAASRRVPGEGEVAPGVMVIPQVPPKDPAQVLLVEHDEVVEARPADRAQRGIGSLRRECTDHVIVTGAAHLRRVLREYVAYSNADRTHVALDKDSPVTRPVLPPGRGRVIALPRVGGLHHRYDRRAA